jgi:hypothetical protein
LRRHGRNAGVLRLRAARFAQDDGVVDGGDGGIGFGDGGVGFGVSWLGGIVQDFGDGGEVAEGVVFGDFFDGLGCGWIFLLAGEVGGGDLEAVEEDAGALVVEVAGGDAAEDVEDGDLDGGAVLDGLHFEDADAAGEGGVAAGAVVVVAEVLGAEGGRAAAVSVGVDVAAEVAAVRVDGGVGVHGGYPLVLWS